MPSPSYVPAEVIGLFNDMAKTYGAVNLLSSFGFSHLWRKKSIEYLAVQSGHQCADLMCGMGEASVLMLQAEQDLTIDAVDFSPGMTERCKQTMARRDGERVTVHTQNVFELSREVAYDRIECAFGLKTFDDAQLRQFAVLIHNLLKSGGRAAFVEIHVPGNRLIQFPYLFYLRHVIPLIGFLCLGNPDCYRHLALYTEDFARRDYFGAYLLATDLKVREEYLFFGCAKVYIAEKASRS